MSITDARFIDRLNLVQEELMYEGDFPGVVDRFYFRANAATGRMALPYHLDRLLQITVDQCPGMIVSPWWEFYAWGPGYQDDFDARGNPRRYWIPVVTDRGEEPVKVPIPDVESGLSGPWWLRVYATHDEDVDGDSPEINIRGLDQNGLIIRTLNDGTADADYTGENIAIDFGVPYTQSNQNFSRITAVRKPQTRDYVRLTAWNGSVEVELSNYAYNETEPSYRHYYVPEIHNRGRDNARDKIVLARCRKRFVPVREDDDPLIISNINALSEMLIAQWKRMSGDLDEYSAHKATAVDILKKEAMGYLGKARVPAISYQRGFPLGAFPSVR